MSHNLSLMGKESHAGAGLDLFFCSSMFFFLVVSGIICGHPRPSLGPGPIARRRISNNDNDPGDAYAWVLRQRRQSSQRASSMGRRGSVNIPRTG